MISSRQVRAARGFLGWSQQELSDRADVALSALKRLEHEAVGTRTKTLDAVQAALEAGGVEFLPPEGGRGEGVRLRVNWEPDAP